MVLTKSSSNLIDQIDFSEINLKFLNFMLLRVPNNLLVLLSVKSGVKKRQMGERNSLVLCAKLGKKNEGYCWGNSGAEDSRLSDMTAINEI